LLGSTVVVSIGAMTCPAGCKAFAFTVAAGYALALWAMRVNRFFSSVIRIQTDRGQHVVTTGPYAFVRHPGYTAGILIIAASGPALGSWLAAALLVIFSLPFLLHRTITDEFFRWSCRATRITPRGSDGGFSRAFGESQTSLKPRACSKAKATSRHAESFLAILSDAHFLFRWLLLAHSGHPNNAIDVAIGCKADMPFCTAYVCL
jgi:hypothetical protein